MKTLLYMLLVFAGIVGSVCRGSCDDASFEIYMIKNDNADLLQAELEQTPLLTADDIRNYNWTTHEILLTDEGLRKMPKENDFKKHGKSFVVVANGIRCYKGAFWATLSAAVYREPVISLGPPYQKRPPNVIRIERAHPSASFAHGPDPRNNETVYKALTVLGKLAPPAE